MKKIFNKCGNLQDVHITTIDLFYTLEVPICHKEIRRKKKLIERPNGFFTSYSFTIRVHSIT